ncbi:MAG: divergent PAP2 family protein [Ruminococcaceae bacterium]|nr:divergent PAP2 family protein [Oscillospiraceae bacterium]
MNWFTDIFSNPFFMTAVGAWFIAQIFKTIIHCLVYKKFDFKRFMGDGGMPSGHSATVSSLATMCGLVFGFRGVEFAISAVVAIIVCHDASGVRRQTGQQAEILNELLKSFEAGHNADLKEWVGHTPLQVLAGVLIGIGNALLVYFLMM